MRSYLLFRHMHRRLRHLLSQSMSPDPNVRVYGPLSRAYIRACGRIVPNFYALNTNCIILKHLSSAKGLILHLPYDAYPIDLN